MEGAKHRGKRPLSVRFQNLKEMTTHTGRMSAKEIGYFHLEPIP